MNRLYYLTLQALKRDGLLSHETVSHAEEQLKTVGKDKTITDADIQPKEKCKAMIVQRKSIPTIRDLQFPEYLAKISHCDRNMPDTIELKTDKWEKAKAKYPDKLRICQQFVNTPITVEEPKPMPIEHQANDIKWQTEIHGYWKGIHNFGICPSMGTQKELNKRKSWFGRKGTYQKFGVNIKCEFCKRDHHVRNCENVITARDLKKKKAMRKLFRYLDSLPDVNWKPFTGSQEEAAIHLPIIWQRLCEIARKAKDEYKGPWPVTQSQERMYPWRATKAIWMKYAMGYPIWLLKLEIRGSQTKWLIKPDRRAWHNLPSLDTPEGREEADRCVEEQLAFGIYWPIPPQLAKQIIPMGIVDIDTSRRPRVIHSGVPINYYEPKYPFKLPVVQDFLMMLEPGEYIGGLDIKKAFNTRPVSPEEATWQCFMYHRKQHDKPECFAVVGDLFGRRNAPYRFWRHTQPYVRFINEMGINTCYYMDDGIYRLSAIEEVRQIQREFILRCASAAGQPINAKKSTIINPKTAADWIGFHIDTTSQMITLTEEKIIQIIEVIDEIRGQETVPCLLMAKILGKLISAVPAIKFVPIFSSNMRLELARRIRHAAIHERDPWVMDYKVEVTEDIEAELEFWTNSIRSLNGKQFWRTSYDNELYSDTSDLTAAAISKGKITQIHLPKAIRTKSSTYRELYGVIMAIINRIPEFANKAIRVLLDNSATVAIMNRTGSKVKELETLCKICAQIQIEHNISISWRWMRREEKEIKLVDKIGKKNTTTNWTFDPQIRQRIIDDLLWPQPTIDGCANASNRTCEKYIAQFWDGQCYGTNIMNHETLVNIDWEKNVLWINPPYRTKFITQLLNLLLTLKIRTIAVLPVWPNTTFWQIIKKHAKQMIFLPASKSLFIPSQLYTKETKAAKWPVVVCIFNIEPKRTHRVWNWLAGNAIPQKPA